jgi:hypothetical protein
MSERVDKKLKEFFKNNLTDFKIIFVYLFTYFI